MAQVAFYFCWVVDGGADLKVAATFGTSANVNLKDAFEELGAAVILHFALFYRGRVEAHTCLGI